MNTKVLMTVTSLLLGLAGVAALFLPETILVALNLPESNVFSVIIQMTGILYFSFALMNWTAKDSAIGGIYARPVSFGNFSHFFGGALLLAKYQLSNIGNLYSLAALLLYTVFTGLFWWLVFKHTGINVESQKEK